MVWPDAPFGGLPFFPCYLRTNHCVPEHWRDTVLQERTKQLEVSVPAYQEDGKAKLGVTPKTGLNGVR